MNEFLITLVYQLAAVLAGLVMNTVVRRFLPIRGRVAWAAGWLLFYVVSTFPSWIGDPNPLYLLPFFLLAFLLLYTGPWYARLITGAVFYALLVPINMLIDTLYFFRRAESWADVLHILVKLALWAVILLAVRRFTVPGAGVSLPPRLWALLGGLSVGPFAATLTFTVWSALNDYQWRMLEMVGYTVLPFVTLSTMAILVAMVVLSRHEALEQERMLAQVRGVYYEGLRREQAEVRTMRHDMHNHLAAAQGLLQAGDGDAALRYLRELSSSAAMQGGLRLCDNDIANAVLASKAAQMRRAGLEGDFAISLPGRLPVADVDLCSLLGNALDNAMEGAAKANDKRVTVRARADKGMLMLRVENALAESPVPGQNGFATTKKDKKNHGLGLAGMRSIAARYGGSLDAKAQNGRFELVVYLPLPSKHE